MKLTLNTLAKSLDLPRETVERWVRQGRMPVQRKRDDYHFNQPALEKWARNQNLTFAPDEAASGMPVEGGPEPLALVMRRGGILTGISGDSVESVLKNATDGMAFLAEPVRSDLYDRLIQREQLNSTGIGKGVAIPHPRTPIDTLNETAITTCFLKAPIDYGAVDDRPVFVLFIMLSPDVQIHLQMLSRLSFCLRDDAFIGFLKTAPDADAFFSEIQTFDNRLEQSGMFRGPGA